MDIIGGKIFVFCRKLDDYRYGGVFKFGQPMVLIRDPELIKTVLIKEFNSFHDNDVESDPEVDPLFGRNPFVLNGERLAHTETKLQAGRLGFNSWQRNGSFSLRHGLQTSSAAGA
jgi:hypothetical protein